MTRQHAKPEDFALVGMSQDPTPGSPGLIEPIRLRYQNIGDAAEKARTILIKAESFAVGRGKAMEGLKEAIGDVLPDQLNKVTTSYHEAAQAYQGYMPRLKEAQEKFDEAVVAALAASPQATQVAPTLGAQPTAAEKTAADQKNAEIATGQEALTKAKSMAVEAQEMRQRAQRDLESVLDDAASQAVKVTLSQRIKEFFQTFPFVQIVIAVAIAIVAAFFPVIGALLGAGLFLFNQVIASQTGGIKAGDFVLGLFGIVPGAALLGLGGKVVRAAGTALRNVPGFAKAEGIVSTFANTSINKVGALINRPFTSVVNSKVVTKISELSKRPIVGPIIQIPGTFVKNFALETGGKAANGEFQSGKAGDVVTGAVLGALGGSVAGAGFKAGTQFVGRGGPGSGKFGDNADFSTSDSKIKRISDQVGGLVEEGGAIGSKIAVGVAQGGDLKEVSAAEAANSASKLAAGPAGKQFIGKKIDAIPIKGSGGSGANSPAPALTPPAQSSSPEPADIPLPASPTTSTSPRPADIPLPASPTTSESPTTTTPTTAPTTSTPTTATPTTTTPTTATPTTATPPTATPTTATPATSKTSPADIPLPPSPS